MTTLETNITKLKSSPKILLFYLPKETMLLRKWQNLKPQKKNQQQMTTTKLMRKKKNLLTKKKKFLLMIYHSKIVFVKVLKKTLENFLGFFVTLSEAKQSLCLLSL